MISISVKAKYGLTAMLELALHYKSGPIQAPNIAKRHDIPSGYLEQVLTELKRDGLIQSFRGANGGYKLAKSASDITVTDILVSVEGPIKISEGHKGCEILDSYWARMEDELKHLFDTSLADLLSDQQKAEKMLVYNI